ncbi:MAG: Gfo/Idh/MocA family oxidoreductase, partial [Prevotella sp.]|nr:Gfo/Idh/MocA family oxidoreductase [Prevotella sp.]
EGISSSQIRERTQARVRVGIAGCGRIASRFVGEAACVNGVDVAAAYDIDRDKLLSFSGRHNISPADGSYAEMLAGVDAVYIATPHLTHYELIREALLAGRHVLCETPMTLGGDEARELFTLAEERDVVLMEANKTAHCPAFNHLMVMVKSGVIGEVVDVEASLSKVWGDGTLREFDPRQGGGSMYELGSYPLLPIIKLLGVNYINLNLYSRMRDGIDIYTKGVFRYERAVCSFKVGLGVKTEGSLIISGTKGYAYVPAPWWKTDYFELRYEDQNDNKKFFYRWIGAGLRYEIQEFVSCIVNRRRETARLRRCESICMADVMQRFGERRNLTTI